MSTTDAVVDPAGLVPLETGCTWRSRDLRDRYVYQLTDAQIDELDAALQFAEARCDDVLDITRDDFPLPNLASELKSIKRNLIDGLGVTLIRGLPVDGYSKRRASMIYWGVGMHLGRPWPQNAKGHLLGDVTDQGRELGDPHGRGNEIGAVAFPFHSDGSDLVGLFCLDPGASGGASLVANVVTIHNEMVRTEPELGAALYASFAYDFRGEQAPGGKPWYTMPIFSRRGSRLFVRYIRPYIDAARRHEGAPRPSSEARAAMDRLDSMCRDRAFHVSMMLQPGDMQFVNNYHVLHARDAYEDRRAEGRIRHLKRLWLETDLLADEDKPEPFRLKQTAGNWWLSKGRTKSELDM
jgi:hypothetical protein